MNTSSSRLSQRLAQWLGPDPNPAQQPPAHRESFTKRCFPWPVRILAVATAGLLGWNWSSTPLGEQLGGGFQYAGLIAISLAVSFWFWVFLLNFALAVLWLAWPLRASEAAPWSSATLAALTFINRQIGHIETLAVWIVLSLVAVDRLPFQLMVLAGTIFLGEPLLNLLARYLFFPKAASAEELSEDMQWKRRPLFYLATFAGIVIVALQAPRQWWKLVPGVAALALADIVRYLRHWRSVRAMAVPTKAAWMRQHHAIQRRMSHHTDVLFGPGLVLGIFALLVVASIWARHHYDQQLAASQPTRGEPVDYCSTNFPPSPADDIQMFIVSDSQFHELQGRRFVGQMEFADALVPVALRPVELDVLSASPLWHFATTYKRLADERAQANKGRLWWAHLGDMADLSCKHEMARSNRLFLDRFDEHALAGIAPGNHDKAFTGNFFWSPYWDTACRSGRLEKRESDDMLASVWRDPIDAQGGRMAPVESASLIAAATNRGTALVTAMPLGPVRHDGSPRGVIAVFLDTSDGQAFDMGVAGLFGTFSSKQGERARAVIEDVRRRAGPLYQDPLYVLFIHHPYDEMGLGSAGRLEKWIAALDAGSPRVIGIVSAHTHEAQKHSHCIGQRQIPEVVVGSTIDPPQEAALLTIGPAPEGMLALRLQTVPSIARPEKTCSTHAAGIPASACQKTMASLRASPACAPLFRAAEASALGRDCSAIENPLAIAGRLQLASRWIGPGDEDEIQADQHKRVRDLFTCICRDDACTVTPEALALDDDAYFSLVSSELRESPAREHELTCLAWAGAAVQRYKTAGMTFADALRCAFDDDNLPPARDYIARMEVIPCQ
jgi:hypothetical protein